MTDPSLLSIAANNLRAARCFQLSAFVMLVYDHFITFDAEVNRIWKQPWHLPTLLFFINRYITPLQRIIIVVAFNDTDWPVNSCKHFVTYEGGGTMVLVAIAEVIMILRVYALYQRNKCILALLCASLVVQVCASAVAVSGGFAQNLPPPLRACILVGTPFFAALWASTLGTDALVFLFTLYKVYQTRRQNLNVPLLEICVRDGVLYFFVIFAANLFNTVMYTVGPPGIKAIGASFSQLITATMISRLQLNLKGVNEQKSGQVWTPRIPYSRDSPLRMEANTEEGFQVSRVIGNLGADMEGVSATSSNRSFAEEQESSWKNNLRSIHPIHSLEKSTPPKMSSW